MLPSLQHLFTRVLPREFLRHPDHLQHLEVLLLEVFLLEVFLLEVFLREVLRFLDVLRLEVFLRDVIRRPEVLRLDVLLRVVPRFWPGSRNRKSQKSPRLTSSAAL